MVVLKLTPDILEWLIKSKIKIKKVIGVFNGTFLKSLVVGSHSFF